MITIESDFIYLTCTDAQAKKLDAVWVKSKKMYKLPNTLGALRELHRLGFDVMEYGKKKAKAREELLHWKNLSDLPFLTPINKNLRPYQRVDVAFLAELPHCGIFSEMRTGKTPTTLKLIEEEGHEKIIVICPASLVLNWEKEVKTWTEGYYTFAVKGTKKQRLKIYQNWTCTKGFLILSKDTAKSDLEELSKLNENYALIVDEAHFLRNYQTQQSKAVFNLGKNATKRLALTGTPSTNKGADIYGILHFLYPARFSSYWAFVDRYFKTWNSPWGAKEISGYKRKEELQEILDLISVQRKRSDVMKWTGEKTKSIVPLEMTSKQRKAYDEMLHLFTVEEAGVDASGVLAQLTRLRQICLSPELLDIKAPSAKEQFILEWLEDNPDEQVIIFSNFSSYLKKLQSKVKESKLIIGETPKQERQNTVDSFQAGKTRIILANIKAAGTGLTLDQATVCIFLDQPYTPPELEQAEDRIVATTETAPKQADIITLVCANSIDEKISKILSEKKNVIDVINDYKGVNQFINEK